MSEIERFLARFPDYETKPEQVAFAKYLEQQGLRFMIDFGFENAERIAWELVEVEGTVQ